MYIFLIEYKKKNHDRTNQYPKGRKEKGRKKNDGIFQK